MKKRILSFLLVLVMAIGFLPTIAFADEPITSGKCGENAIWSFNETTGTLTISGTGEVTSSLSYHINDSFVNEIIIEEGITAICNSAFAWYYNVEKMYIPSTLKKCTEGSFILCANILYYNGTQAEFFNLDGIGKPDYFHINFIKDSMGMDRENVIYTFNKDKKVFTYFIDSKVIDFDYIKKEICVVKIEDGISTISKNKFENSVNVKSIAVPLSVVEIKEYAFNNCSALEEIIFEGTEQQWNDIIVYPFNNSLKNAKVYFNTTYHEHFFNNYIYNNDATTEKDGTETSKCDKCDKTDTRVKSGTKLPTQQPQPTPQPQPQPTPQPTPQPQPVEKPIIDTTVVFTDVAQDWYTQYVNYAVTYGIFKGNEDGTFKPLSNITRAEFVQVLANITGVDTSNKQITTKFSDVKAGDWFAPAVKWANENGIVAGKNATQYGPEENITREQMCVMIVNYAKFKGITLKAIESKEAFVDDAAISSWAKDAVYACQMADIVNGKGEGRFDPAGTGLRAEASVIFTKFHQNYLK